MKRIAQNIAIAMALVESAAVAHADLVLTHYYNPGVSIINRVERFSNSGTFLDAFNNNGSTENLGGVSPTPDGSLYALGNFLGGGGLFKYTFGIPAYTTLPTGNLIALPSGLAVDASSVYVASTAYAQYPGSLTGILQFDAGNGAFVQNAIPISNVNDLEFGPNGRLYVAGQTSITRYTIHPGSTPTQDLFLIPTSGPAVTGDIEFRPGSSDLYLMTNQGSIQHYNSETGDFLGTLVTPGAPAITAASEHFASYTFDDSGTLYVLTHDGITQGGRILRYNADSGAFMDSIFDSGANNPYVGIQFVSVPEPVALSVGIAGVIALLCRRPAKRP